MKVSDIYKKPEKKKNRLLSLKSEAPCAHLEEKRKIQELQEKIQEIRNGPYFNPLPIDREEIAGLGLSKNAFFRLKES